MEIIPAIDLIDGKCVRLSMGDYTQKTVYTERPEELAKKFEDIGCTRLHLVDLDGAKGKPLQHLFVLEEIAKTTSLEVDFGGGINKTSDVKSVLNAGASMINISSIIIRDSLLFTEWIGEFGPEKFLPGADVLDYKIKINGWQHDSGKDLFSFVDELKTLGISQVFCTDISKDGMLKGPSIVLYKELLARFSDLKLIASGGVASIDDLKRLQSIGCSGAIIGKAWYEGKISMNQIQEFLKEN